MIKIIGYAVGSRPANMPNILELMHEQLPVEEGLYLWYQPEVTPAPCGGLVSVTRAEPEFGWMVEDGLYLGAEGAYRPELVAGVKTLWKRLSDKAGELDRLRRLDSETIRALGGKIRSGA